MSKTDLAFDRLMSSVSRLESALLGMTESKPGSAAMRRKAEQYERAAAQVNERAAALRALLARIPHV